MRGVNCLLVHVVFANSFYFNYSCESLNDCKLSVYYACSQAIKAFQETSNGWTDVSSCIFSIALAAFWGSLVRQSSRFHAASPCTCRLPVFTHRLQCTAWLLLQLFPPGTKHFQPLTSPVAGSLHSITRFSVRFICSKPRLLTQVGASTEFHLLSLLSNTMKLLHSSFISSFFF